MDRGYFIRYLQVHYTPTIRPQNLAPPLDLSSTPGETPEIFSPLFAGSTAALDLSMLLWKIGEKANVLSQHILPMSVSIVFDFHRDVGSDRLPLGIDDITRFKQRFEMPGWDCSIRLFRRERFYRLIFAGVGIASIVKSLSACTNICAYTCCRRYNGDGKIDAYVVILGDLRDCVLCDGVKYSRYNELPNLVDHEINTDQLIITSRRFPDDEVTISIKCVPEDFPTMFDAFSCSNIMSIQHFTHTEVSFSIISNKLP